MDNDFCVVGPCDLNICFEAQRVLAEVEHPENEVKALHFADPGCITCARCEHYMMREGDVMCCSKCNALTHVDTGLEITWEDAWLINHRPPGKAPSIKETPGAALMILENFDKREIAKRVDQLISLSLAMEIELDIARSVTLNEGRIILDGKVLKTPLEMHYRGEPDTSASDYETGG